uniref:SFRICE_029540 n=1 Tax=Spodoptera frugiperda TaxID=7108 RepID=A0A2H1WH84_SPOFR
MGGSVAPSIDLRLQDRVLCKAIRVNTPNEQHFISIKMRLIQPKYFAVSVKMMYSLRLHVLSPFSARRDTETTPLSLHLPPSRRYKPPPESPTQGPAPLRSPVEINVKN